MFCCSSMLPHAKEDTLPSIHEKTSTTRKESHNGSISMCNSVELIVCCCKVSFREGNWCKSSDILFADNKVLQIHFKYISVPPKTYILYRHSYCIAVRVEHWKNLLPKSHAVGLVCESGSESGVLAHSPAHYTPNLWCCWVTGLSRGVCRVI